MSSSASTLEVPIAVRLHRVHQTWQWVVPLDLVPCAVLSSDQLMHFQGALRGASSHRLPEMVIAE